MYINYGNFVLKNCNMTKYNEKFIAAAISLAVNTVKAGKGGPFGAVVVKDGKIIGKGINLVTSSNDPTAHAEIVAIRDACRKLGSFQLGGCEIYVNCEPCPMCIGAIYWARFAKLYFAANRKDAADVGFSDALIYDDINVPFEERRIQTIVIDHHDKLAPFNEWRNKKDKVHY
jgi:guanine deaminase